MKTYRHQNQLLQLKKLNPEIHQQASTLLDNGLVEMASKIIIEAMHQALIKEQLWQIIVSRIESQNVPYFKKSQDAIARYNGYDVNLYRRPIDDRIVLYHAVLGSSAPIAQWGRDFDPNHQSSAYRGCWKLTAQARENFETWLDYKPSPRRWRKQAGGWAVK